MLQKMCVFIMFLIDFRLALRFLLLFTLEPVDGQEFVSDLQQLLSKKKPLSIQNPLKVSVGMSRYIQEKHVDP